MKKDYAKKFWDLFDSGDKDTLEKEYPFSFLVCTTGVVDEEVIGSSRWYDFVKSVLKLGDRYMAVEWNRGKTELQDDDFDDVEYYEVVPKEKTITVLEWVQK
jgi:hypothetical protein